MQNLSCFGTITL